VRPFFLDPKTQAPLASKRYYDVISWVVTQVAFYFTTTPFLVLSMSGCLEVWGRVYFYTVAGVAVSMAFFASPAKAQLRRALETRAAKAGVVPATTGGAGSKTSQASRPDVLSRTTSTDSINSRVPMLGLSQDPVRDLDEAIMEIKSDMEAAKAEFEAKKAEFEGMMAKKSR